jgi:hypothetical protein
MKRKPLNITAYDIDIMGEREAFQVPDSAMYFETIQAVVREDMKHDTLIQDLRCKSIDMSLQSDVLIHDLDDKIKLVNKLHRKGLINQWYGVPKKVVV